MDKFDEFARKIDAKIEQLHEQMHAQQLVIAWLLSQLEYSEDFQPDRIRDFLYDQADELADNPQYREYVAVIDSLFESVVHLSSRRHNRD